MLDLVTFAAFALIVSLVWLFSRMIARLQHDPIRDRLAAAGTVAAFGGKTETTGGQFMESLAQQFPQAPFENGELDQDIRRAGYYRPTARREFLAIRNALAILVVLLTGAAAVAIGPERERLVVRVVLAGMVTAVVAWALPRVLLAIRARRRVQRVRNALPNAMDMVSMCLAGGLPLQESLANVSRELFQAHPDLAVEMAIVRQQTEMNTLAFAFQQFAARIDTEETIALASLIGQTQRLGSSVADSFREFADSLRLKRRQLADEQSGKTQLRLLFPIIFCLVPSVLILLWGPAILEIWSFFQSMAGPLRIVQ